MSQQAGVVLVGAGTRYSLSGTGPGRRWNQKSLATFPAPPPRPTGSADNTTATHPEMAKRFQPLTATHTWISDQVKSDSVQVQPLQQSSTAAL